MFWKLRGRCGILAPGPSLSLLWSDAGEEGTEDWTPVRKPAVVESFIHRNGLRAVLSAWHTVGALTVPVGMGTVHPTRC